MRIAFLLSFILIGHKINAQWINADSSSSIFFHGLGSQYPIFDDNELTGRTICELPKNTNDSFNYKYYLFSNQTDLIYFELTDKFKNKIIQTGYYRLVYKTTNYINIDKNYNGYIITCWVKDFVWTEIINHELKTIFYNKGELQRTNGLEIKYEGIKR